MISLVYKNIDDVAEAAVNPKLHDTELLIESFQRWGFIQPLVENEATRRLVAGHGRLEALREMRARGLPAPGRIRVVDGTWHAPVLTGVSFENEAEAEAYLVADNRLVEVGGWNSDELRGMLAEMAAEGYQAIGWTGADLQQVLLAASAPEPVAPPPEYDSSAVEEALLKQVVLYYSSTEFAEVVSRLQGVMVEKGLDSHTAVLMFLLGEHEKNRSDVRSA